MFIRDTPAQRDIRQAYDLWSSCYDTVAAPWEADARRRALGMVRGRRVLDVGVGSGGFFTEILRHAGPHDFVCGAELSHRMVRRARGRLRREANRGVLVEASGLRLPFSADAFDVVVSSYVLDLLAIPDIEAALAEFYRVLRPAGRIVLINLTKLDQARTTWYERCYRLLPSIAQAYLLGGCRPVQIEPMVIAAGFAEAQRTLVRQFLSSEIVVAAKPQCSDLAHAA